MIEPVDVPPEVAERIRRRGQRVLAREAAIARAPWLVRAEAAWGRHGEPVAVAIAAVAILVWSGQVLLS